MKITIIRHGKVNMQWKRWYTSEQFDEDCANYDIAPIHPINAKTEVFAETVYTSTLNRSRETAEQLLNVNEFCETELLNEVPLKSFCECKVLLPLWVWNVMGRLQWIWQSKRQPEGRLVTQRRADSLIERLLEKNQDCVLVTHGFFMRTLIKELKRHGFVIDNTKLGFANLEKITATK